MIAAGVDKLVAHHIVVETSTLGEFASNAGITGSFQAF